MSARQRIFHRVAQLEDVVGQPLGRSDWLTIDQPRIDQFASATRDHQWIHVDPDRAAEGPFGSTIAHGWLTLSLLPVLADEVYTVEGATMAVNYGSDRIRLLSPVRVGSRLRAAVTIAAVTRSAAGCRVATEVTAELDGADRPACVAQFLTVWSGLPD